MTAPLPSFRAAYAKHLLDGHLLAKLNEIPGNNYGTLPPAKSPEKLKNQGEYEGRICIIGAGASGLYAAMMLKYIGITNVDILEANDRVGGRCDTKSLSDDNDYHNYYDVGAMRIPEIPPMLNFLNFIDFLGLASQKKPYVFKNEEVPSCYWYRHDVKPGDDFDKFMKPIAEAFINDFEPTFEQWLHKPNDNYSTRAFLMTGPHPEAPDPHWTYDQTAAAEVFVSPSGLFDQSFTEAVIDYTEFQAARDRPWWRIDGGVQRFTDSMEAKLASTSWPKENSAIVKVTTDSPVVTLSHLQDKKPGKIAVTVSGKQADEYDMVFNTTAMGPLHRMDIQDLGLPDNIQTAIRTLGYGRATKVAIKFAKPWWKICGGIYGGVSPTDLPISNVVYPSWDDGNDKPAVLMVSYSWGQDATRMGALVPDYSRVQPSKDDPIVTLCLENLVKLWEGRDRAPSFEYLSDLYMTHHAYAWDQDPYTGGAFALFAPGQFKNIYPAFQTLFCDEKFAMCGEALSAHHAWISGALDSAYVKVIMFLTALGRTHDVESLKSSPFGGGEGFHAEELDVKLMNWSLELGRSLPEE